MSNYLMTHCSVFSKDEGIYKPQKPGTLLKPKVGQS